MKELRRTLAEGYIAELVPPMIKKAIMVDAQLAEAFVRTCW